VITKTFNGCKIKVRAGRGANWGQMMATVNGGPFFKVEKRDETKAIAEIERLLAFVHADPISGDRWPASYYAPGTYELCDKNLHPRPVGGQCAHVTCRQTPEGVGTER
jgi:hypothetical protein